MATLFGNGQMEDLPVGVVDEDNTSASREIARRVDATPTLRITRQYANETEARRDVQRKTIYGYLLIPSDFTEKAGNNQEATLCYYYHNAMLSVGGENELADNFVCIAEGKSFFDEVIRSICCVLIREQDC